MNAQVQRIIYLVSGLHSLGNNSPGVVLKKDERHDPAEQRKRARNGMVRASRPEGGKEYGTELVRIYHPTSKCLEQVSPVQARVGSSVLCDS